MASRVRSVRCRKMTHARRVARFHAGVVVYFTPPPPAEPAEEGVRSSGVRSCDVFVVGASSVGRSDASKASFESVAGNGRVRQYLRCTGK